MALPHNIRDREHDKFTENSSGETAVRVVGDMTVDSNPFAPPGNTDTITVTQGTTTEVYNFRNGGPAGTILRTVTLTYTDSTKQCLSQIDVVNP